MSYRDMYEKWLNSPALSEAEKEELRSIANDEKEIESRFFAPLEFGTAGLRGTMCVGLHQMNIHVIRHATQAFAEVILAEGGNAAERGVAVCFDCRNHSDEFAREAACVMAANVGIAGSTTVGDHCMIGGAAMINGHITIPSGSNVGPATAITGWGKEPMTKTGFYPALDPKNFALTAASISRLPEMRKQLRELARAVKALEEKA